MKTPASLLCLFYCLTHIVMMPNQQAFPLPQLDDTSFLHDIPTWKAHNNSPRFTLITRLVARYNLTTSTDRVKSRIRKTFSATAL